MLLIIIKQNQCFEYLVMSHTITVLRQRLHIFSYFLQNTTFYI